MESLIVEDIGCLAALQGHSERALRLVSAEAVLRGEIGAPLSPAKQTRLKKLLEPAIQNIPLRKQAAWEGYGRSLSLEEAVEEALNGIS